MDMARRSHKVTFIATTAACLTLIASTAIGAVSAVSSHQAAEASLATVEEAKVARLTAQRQDCLDDLVAGQILVLALATSWSDGRAFDAQSPIPQRDPQQELALTMGSLKSSGTCSVGQIPAESDLATALDDSFDDLFWAFVEYGTQTPRPSQQDLDTCAVRAVEVYAESTAAAARYLADLLKDGEADPSFTLTRERCSKPDG